MRGDAAEDGRIDLTDAVFVLDYLFLGTVAPGCLDALDIDDDGQVNLTDAIYVLGYLFLGSEPPPAPFEEAGADATADALGCR